MNLTHCDETKEMAYDSQIFRAKENLKLSYTVGPTKDKYHAPTNRLKLYNVSSQRNNIMNLTHCDETKEMAYDSQIFRAKENLKLSYTVGPTKDKYQAPTNRLKLYIRAII